jgi:hypothetical protein
MAMFNTFFYLKIAFKVSQFDLESKDFGKFQNYWDKAI